MELPNIRVKVYDIVETIALSFIPDSEKPYIYTLHKANPVWVRQAIQSLLLEENANDQVLDNILKFKGNTW